MQERDYLLRVVEKSGYVIIVLQFDSVTGHSELEYISPNADTFGMNVEFLRRGIRLVEDYIYPDDRTIVMETIQKAISSKVDSYVHNFKLVSDNGAINNISDEIYIAPLENGKYRVEFYMINEVEGAKTPIKTNVVKSVDFRNDYIANSQCDDIWKMYQLDSINNFVRAFSEVSELYSVVVDKDGCVVFSPVGPALNLGDFYDLFDTPAYKKYFQYIKNTIDETMTPTVFDREEGGDGKLSAAPILRSGKVIGYWILGSYTKEESEELCRICESQWVMVKEIANYIDKAVSFDLETAKSKGVSRRLKEELEKQSIINDALNNINTRKDENVEDVIFETLRDVGKYLDVERVFLCTLDNERSREYKLRSCWASNGSNVSDSFFNALVSKMFVIEECLKTQNGTYKVNSSDMTDVEKYNLVTLGIKAILAHAIYVDGNYYGALFFVEDSADRNWTKQDISFTKSISIAVQGILENAEGDDNIRRVNKHLIDSYNIFRAGIFIKDNYSGKVLFANDSINSMLGYDFVGMDSRVVISSSKDLYTNFSNSRPSPVEKSKVTKWKSYVKVFDDIMDIVEVNMEWLQGQDASLFVIRKAKEF